MLTQAADELKIQDDVRTVCSAFFMCSTDGGRFIMLWEENQHREAVQALIVNKDAYHLCAFPKQQE